MDRYLNRSIRCILWCLAIFTLSATIATARQTVDMKGRRIDVPEPLLRVYVASPPENHLACAIDPSLMVGLNFPVGERDRQYLPRALWGLPVIGSFFGPGHTPNLEVLLRARPQLVLCWQKNAVDVKFDAFLQRFHIPIAYISLEHLEDYPANIRLMGRMLGRTQRAEKLAAHAAGSLAQILPRAAAIPAGERVRVYYAEGPDGLRTDARGSWHTELIRLAGGVNVHEGDIEDLFGMEQVSMEQVLLYRPEVILVQDPSFYQRIYSLPGWRHVPAVQNRRVYLIPGVPFNWFDRPPSFMRLLGLKWVAHTLYPQRFAIDMEGETREFYRLFLQVELTPHDIRYILENGEEPNHG